MDISQIAPSGKLSNIQIELLKLFTRDIPDEDMIEIRSLLSRYFMEKARDEMDKLFEEKGWGQEKLEEWANEHWRSTSIK